MGVGCVNIKKLNNLHITMMYDIKLYGKLNILT